MSPRRLSILTAIVILLGGTVAIANPTALFSRSRSDLSQGDRMAENAAPMGEGWLKQLNLNREQVQKIRAIRSQYRSPLTQQRQAVQKSQQQLRDLMSSNASAEQIRQQYSQVKTLRQQLDDTQFNTLLETREVLTLEQRRKFGEQMQGPRRMRNRPQARMEPQS